MALSKQVNACFYISVFLFLFTYITDYYFFSTQPVTTLVVEIGAELVGVLYLIHALKKPNSLAILMLVYIFCFFISDVFYAYIFYFANIKNPTSGVWTVSFTNTVSYLSISIVLFGLNRSFLRSRLRESGHFVYLPVCLVICSFLTMSYLLFGSTYSERYSVNIYSMEDYVRLSAAYSGALALSIGFIGLRYSRNLISGMLSLGVVLQVFSDWILKHKNYIQAESYISIGENMFMVGIILYVCSSLLYCKEGYKVNEEPIPDSGDVGTVLIICIGLYLAKHFNRDDHVIEISFIYICIYGLIVFKQTIYEIMKLEQLKTLLVSESMNDIKFLPREYVAIRETLSGHFEKISKYNSISQTIRYVAHDLKAPFTTLKAASEILYSAKNKPHKIVKVLDTLKPEIDEASKSIENMIDNILTVAEKITLKKEKVKISKLICEELYRLKFASVKSKVDFVYSINDEYVVEIDVECFRRVITNIVQNAYQAIGKQSGHYISIKLSSSKDQRLTISIENSGSFISEDRLATIFDDFTTHGKENGTGLGLAIAKKMVELHGGSIGVKSNAQGPTTVFYILIPYIGTSEVDASRFPKNSDEIKKWAIKNTKDSHSIESSECRQMISEITNLLRIKKFQLRIGIIEDDVFVAEFIMSLINENHSLNKFITAIFIADDITNELSEINLLICDIDLSKNLSGLDFIKQYKKKYGSEISICAHSNRVYGEDMKNCLEAGADYFIPKPIQFVHLLRYILDSLPSILGVKISYRDGKYSDIDSFNKIIIRAKHNDGYDSEYIESFRNKSSITHEILSENPSTVIMVNDKLVGFFILDLSKVYLDYLFIDVAYHRQGYGSLLWSKAIKKFLDLGYNKFKIWADPNAEGFYLKKGCIEVEKKQSPYKEGLETKIFEFTIVQ